MSYAEQLQAIANDYMRAGEPWPATARQIAAWAVQSGRWQPQRSSLIDRCAEELSRAMREEYLVDPQGRSVRAKHAARDEQGAFSWADIRSARPEHMRVSFQQRRQQIVGDCKQLKSDVDSYNENAKPARLIQLVLDFTNDVAEAQPSASVPRSTQSPPTV